MSKKIRFQTPSGMHDILPQDFKYFEKILDVAQKILDFYSFERIETPIVEYTELFTKGIGVSTDIVEKEMFSFKTKGGDFLALRPEGTAPIARAFIQHGMQNLPQPVKLWYFGPFFRHEKPQLGRYRQFWQLGIEILGEKTSALDVQVIEIFYLILSELKIKNLKIRINSIGDSFCRPYYKKVLGNYFKGKFESLCLNCRKRLQKNPLRILDCKDEKCQRIIAGAPQILDHLCEECKIHLREVLEYIEELKLPYQLDPKLVRGLDYYTKTVFEIELEEEKETGSLVGGGRYDGLVKLLGGPDTPAVGGAAGIDRIVMVMKKRDLLVLREEKPKVFLAQIGALAKRKSFLLLEEFRKEKIPVIECLGKDSLKAQLKLADKLGVKYVLILGQKEAIEGDVILREMESGIQEKIKLKDIIKKIKQKIKK